VTISPWQFKSLLADYAEHQVNGARSQLGDHRSGAAGSCVLTVGIIVSRTPAAYRIKGESILAAWCSHRKREAEILDEIAATRTRRNCTTKANVYDACGKKLKQLDRALRLATEQTYRIEDNPHFDAAVDALMGEEE
jgi:hypothetical protein